MLGAVQLGVLAACVVLFVPMGMAGWHLSRNKMLFFSGALFITLAVGVHLTPYFPSMFDFVSSVSSASVRENRESCVSSLHDVVYDVRPVTVFGHLSSNSSYDSLNNEKSWEWRKSNFVIVCHFRKFSRSDASDLLNGSWVVVAGDSQARLVALELLDLVMDDEAMESVRRDLFKRHSNYKIMIDEIGMRLEFVWAPYVGNLTDLMVEYRQTKNYPDVLLMGSGLWHMLHVTNASDYGASLKLLRKASLLPLASRVGSDGPLTESVSIRLPHLFWLGMPVLINTMLNTEEKRQKMDGAMQDSYDSELYRSKLLRGFGGPLQLLDIHLLSQKCGNLCTVDGMHYGGAVYEAAIHIMLNALLIESNQLL